MQIDPNTVRWDSPAPAAPSRPAQSAPVRQPPAFIPGVPKNDPYKADDQRLQQQAAALAADKAERDRREWEATHNPDGSPKTAGKAVPVNAQTKAETGVGFYENLANSQAAFNDEFAGNTFTGNLENTIQGAFDNFGTPGQRDWWATFRRTDNEIRNNLFGATLTPSEQASYEATSITPSMDPKQIRANLKTRTELIGKALDRQKRFYIANGYDPDAIEILYEPLRINQSLSETPPPPPGQDADFGPTLADTGNALPFADPGAESVVPGGQGGASGYTPPDPAYVSAYRARLAAAAKSGNVDSLLNWMTQYAGNKVTPEYLAEARASAIAQYQYLRKYPNAPIESMEVGGFYSDKPLSAADQAINSASQSAPGAYAMGAADTISAGTLDNIIGATGGNAERARTGMSFVADKNPVSNALGQVTGGVLASVGGEAALARLGVGAGVARGIVSDAAYGGAYGAGSSDNGSRFTGALKGAAASAVGSAAGQGTTNALARMANPTGGSMNALYEAGVRPTIGQRMQNAGGGRGFKGLVGKTVNALEEGAQSIPIVGNAIRGARQESRDQFQLGAFNEALKEIGEKLPKGMQPGTAPNAYAQKSFDRVYAEARKGMRVVADEDLTNDLQALGPDISTLGEDLQNRLAAILKNRVANNFVGGMMDGEGFKKAASDLGKMAKNYKASSDAGQRDLGEVIEGVKDILDSAARRHSSPEAVELLDAADAGYAKLVRIEDAAARAGGDAGAFSPNQFDRAVQKQSGGVRSKAYLRGDALMQDYAAQGSGLVDRFPDSGTAGRVAVGGVATGAYSLGALSPAVVATLAAIGGAYAPGVRKLMQGSMAPGGPTRQAISAQLAKRARLVGRAGATTGAVGVQERLPAP